MLTSQKIRLWRDLFIERVYQLCNQVHPGMSIDRDAVSHICHIISDLLRQLLDTKPTTLAEVEKNVTILLPQQAAGIVKEAHEFINSWPPKKSHRNYNTVNVKTMCDLHSKLVLIIKEYLGLKDKEKKDREKEIEKMALFVLNLCDYLTEDMLKWAGHYVKNVRNVTMSISLQNLQIALNADKNLMELTEIVHNGDEDSEGLSLTGTTLLFDFDLNNDEERHQRVEADYGKIAREFLHYESQYVSTLSLLVNVFRRRFETACTGANFYYLDDIFGNISELHELSLQVERCLEDAIEMCDTPSVGTILWPLAEGHDFDCYIDFLETITSTTQGGVEKILKDKALQNFFDNEERVYSSQQGGQTFRLIVRYVLPSLLNVPVVHFYRIVEFIKRLSMTSNSHEDRIDLENILGYFNPLVAKMENLLSTELRLRIKLDRDQRQLNDSPISQLERLQQIQKRIDAYEGKNIGQTCAELMKEGTLQMVRPSLSTQPLETLRRGRSRILTERYLYVFDQLVLLCKSHKNGIKFKERLNIRKTEMRDIEDNDEMKHAFRIESFDKTSNQMQVYTFLCKCKPDKESWMTVLINLQTKSILDRLLDNYTKEEKRRIPLVIPDPEQYRFAEPDTEENIMFEDYTSSSGVPVVKKGTVAKLVERLTFHLYTDNNYVKTFLISYRSFCTSAELLAMLIERFEVPVPARLQPQSAEIRPGGPLAGRYDTVQSHGLSSPPPSFIHSGAISEQSFQRFRKEYERPIQRRVLSVLQQWVKMHWYDFENNQPLTESLAYFLRKSCDTPGKLTNQHRKFAKIILASIERKKSVLFGSSGFGLTPGHTNNGFEMDEPGVIPPLSPTTPSVSIYQQKPPEVVWHTAQKGDTENYDLLSLHPIEIARQLTLYHFDLYQRIKPIELVDVAWMKKDKQQRSPQLLNLIDHSNNLTWWLARSIVDTDSLEERVALLERTLEVMCVFEELHNFTGLVAFYSALNSSYMCRLTWTWGRLEAHHEATWARFQLLCGEKWQEMIKRLQSIDPPCIPFFGHYMDHICKMDVGNPSFERSGFTRNNNEENGLPTSPTSNKLLVSFLKCRRIAGLIGEIQMYQNKPYVLTVEPSIRKVSKYIY
ncbi:unnamed protein product, partial [Mesorhabditis belari]|uniref:Uncharacterized protein n=1 Tax=Mesorhabditis belari TaxID=2138241 RepID=A0AAF3FCZ5_9BILA